MALVRPLHGLKDQLSGRSGKDIADGADIQHASARKALNGRLMAGSAIADDGNAVRICKVLADDEVSVNFDDVAIYQTHAFQQFISQGCGIVHELLHFHAFHSPLWLF